VHVPRRTGAVEITGVNGYLSIMGAPMGQFTRPCVSDGSAISVESILRYHNRELIRSEENNGGGTAAFYGTLSCYISPML
jgi:hypothetical protein